MEENMKLDAEEQALLEWCQANGIETKIHQGHVVVSQETVEQLTGLDMKKDGIMSEPDENGNAVWSYTGGAHKLPDFIKPSRKTSQKVNNNPFKRIR